MSTKQLLHALKGKRRERDAEHISWENVLLQITLPITLILAFVAITKLSETIAKYKQKVEAIDRIIGIYQGTSFGDLVDQNNEIIIELQRQRIIKALDRLRHSQRLQLGLFAYPDDGQMGEPGKQVILVPLDPAEIHLQQWWIEDPEWRVRFQALALIYRDRKRINQHIFANYRLLLPLTGENNRPSLRDPLADGSATSPSVFMARISAASSKTPDAAGLPIDQKVIGPAIRRFAWDELEKFSSEIKAATLALQLGIIQRISGYFVTNPEAVKEITLQRRQREDFRRFLEDPNAFTDEETTQLMQGLAAAIEKFIRTRLERDQFNFLDEVWQFHNSGR